MIMGKGSFLRRGFKKCLFFAVFMMLFYAYIYLTSYPYKGLVGITLIIIVGAYSFIILLIYFYLLEAVRSIGKTIILAVIPLLLTHLNFFTYRIFIDTFSDPIYIGKFLTETFHLTIAYIPFGTIYFIILWSEKRKVA
jgi:hypothetical protein